MYISITVKKGFNRLPLPKFFFVCFLMNILEKQYIKMEKKKKTNGITILNTYFLPYLLFLYTVLNTHPKSFPQREEREIQLV